jgi:NAD(P)H-dependent flavin oxidoreductase YrpB (nitropropane dioxygenase family)
VLRSEVVRDWEAAGRPAAGSRPDEGRVAARYEGLDIPLYADVPPLRGMSGDLHRLQMPAGQGVGAITRRRPAGEIVRELAGAP